MNFLFLLLMFNIILYEGSSGVKILEIKVPPYIKFGDDAHLICRYDMEKDKLYSVSWYKDNNHIYRFGTNKSIYDLDGINVDIERSTNQDLWLRKVYLESSGTYKCEVNTDKPEFKSVLEEAYMEVINYPDDEPKITGKEKVYANGDVLILNCTSGFSFPPAVLQWFINGSPINPESPPVYKESDLKGKSTSSSLRIELNADYLRNERISVKCKSIVKSLSFTKEKIIDVKETEVFVVGGANIFKPLSKYSIIALLLLILLY